MGQKKRTAGQGLKLLLIRDYLYNEASKEHPKNAKKIQEFLQEHRIAASTKTIYTDIMRLKEDLELPIAYSGKGERGFYITEKPFDPAELRLMIDCIRNAEFITKDDAATLTDKIVGLASSPDRKLLTYRLEEENRKSETEASVIDNIPLLIKAIENRRKISFNRYHYVANRTTHTFLGTSEYIVSPHKLIRKSNKCILEYAEDFEGGGQVHRKIDVSMLTNIRILNAPSTYREMGSLPGEQTMDEALDWLLGKKRAITIRFRNEVLGEVINKLGENTVLIDVDKYHFKTTIVDRASSELLSWIAGFGCKAKILAPNDIIEQFMCQQKMRLYDYDLLYKRDYEPISILTDEELSLLSGEKFDVLMYDERALFPPEYTVEGEK